MKPIQTLAEPLHLVRKKLLPNYVRNVNRYLTRGSKARERFELGTLSLGILVEYRCINRYAHKAPPRSA